MSTGFWKAHEADRLEPELDVRNLPDVKVYSTAVHDTVLSNFKFETALS